VGWRLAQLPLVRSMDQDRGQMCLTTHHLPFAREMLDMCRYCVFYCFDGCGSEDSDDFYTHTTLVAVLVGPLTLMTCGLLVLSTLLDEVSMCTNSRSIRPFTALLFHRLLGLVFCVILHNEKGRRKRSDRTRGSQERLDFLLCVWDSVQRKYGIGECDGTGTAAAVWDKHDSTLVRVSEGFEHQHLITGEQ